MDNYKIPLKCTKGGEEGMLKNPKGPLGHNSSLPN